MDPSTDSAALIQNVISTVTNLWQAVLAPAGLALWVLWKFIVSRTDKHREAASRREADDMAERKRQADRMDQQTMGYISRIEADNTRLRAEVEAKDKDLDRCSSLLRGWFNLAHEAWNNWYNLLGIANARLVAAGLEPLPPERMPHRLSQDLDAPKGSPPV